MPDWVFWIFLFFVTVVIHEICHGLAALALGDPTAKLAGRLSLNPLRHVDPFWTVIFPVLLFFSTGGRFAIGMAKPVPVNFGLLRPRRLGMVLVALAGPVSNLFMAALFNLFFKATGHVYFLYAIYVNLGVAIFNMVPVPPLDGSRVVAGILPEAAARFYMKLEPVGFLLVFVLYLTGILLYWILPGMHFFCRFLDVPQLMLR